MSKHEIELKETTEGDLYFNLPDDLMTELGWEEGDDLKFTDDKKGVVTIKKVKYETIELDFDDEELLKYMIHAHDQGMSFNEWVEHSLEEIIKELQ